MSDFVQRLEITAHPRLEKSLGYQSENRWVAWHWEPDIEQLTYTDGKNVGAGKNIAWRVFLEHPLIRPAVEKYHLSETDQYWLLLDRQTRNLYVGEGKAIQSLLEQPESLTLLACLDGNSNPLQETAESVQQTIDTVTNSQPFRTLSYIIPIGTAAILTAAVGLGTWNWVVPTVQQKLAGGKLNESPVSPTADCGDGGSSDFSAYVNPSRGHKEMHLIGVYEARPDHSGGNHPQGEIKVKVERQNQPMVLALSAYEPVRWNITKAPGTVIKKIIINGYHDQTITGISGIPVEEHSYEDNGRYLGNFLYQWGATPDSLDTPSLVNTLEKLNSVPLTSFQGCYRGTTFVIK